jgi:hypothetical protein
MAPGATMVDRTLGTMTPCRRSLPESTKSAPEPRKTCPPETPLVQPEPNCVPVKVTLGN